MNQNRFKSIGFAILICYLVVAGRMFFWQVIKSSTLNRYFLKQLFKPTTLSASRGIIYDDNEFPLAENQQLLQISIYKPDLKKKPQEVISLLNSTNTPLSEVDTKSISDFFLNDQAKWITLKTLFNPTDFDLINIKGLVIDQINKRIYPEKSTTGRRGGSLDGY